MNKYSRKDLLRWCAQFSTLNAVFLILVGFRFLSFSGEPENIKAWLYAVVTILGHFGTLSFLPFVLLSLLVATLLFHRFVHIAAVVMFLIMDLGLLVDTFIFAQYRYHFNGFVLGMLFGGAAGDIFQFSTMMYIVAGSSVVLVFLGFYFFGKQLWRANAQRQGKWYKWSIYTFLVLMVCSHLIHAFAGAMYYRPVTKLARTFPLYAPLSANTFLYKTGLVDQSAARENIRSLNTSTKASGACYPLEKLSFNQKSASDSLSVLLIVLDSWRYDMLDSTVMPNLFAFSKKSQVFLNHKSGSNGTRGGIFSLFYGLPSMYWDTMKAAQQEPELMKHIRSNGISTGIFTSAALTSPAFDKTVFAGFDSLRLRTEGANPNTSWNRDLSITKEWQQFLSRQPEDKTFFGFLFYDAPHGYSHPDDFEQPFQPAWKAPNYLGLDNDSDPTEFKNLYKNSVHWNDHLLGKVFRQLEKSGRLSSTIIIVTGDHGQEFNDNKQNYWGHGSNFTDEQIKVPMLVFWPGKQAKEYRHLSQHYDVVPTLMQDWLGCTNSPGKYSFGQRLFDTRARDWMISGSYDNFGLIEEDRITVTYTSGTYEIFDRKMTALPESRLRASRFNRALQEVNRFYMK
ncbi:MAG: DUF3413 domain-containing protein [Cytophagales bacterium]|nr:DUF3413 domain-containing protein [Cytophagales bacterium]